MQADSQARLPPRTTRLEVQYAVLNLASLLKTRFRHRLAGFDADWIDAGTRTEAFYTNLPPRNYQFQVIASNDDGTWSEPAATWDFSIAPMFYQTTWFAVVCVAAAIGAVAGIWHLHLRQVRQRFALLLGERARLSREIHDTLLQSLVGVALQLDVVANDLESVSAADQGAVRADAQERGGIYPRSASVDLEPALARSSGVPIWRRRFAKPASTRPRDIQSISG